MAAAEIDAVLDLGVDELRRRYSERELSPVEVIAAVSSRIERTQPQLNAFVTLCLERAGREAERAAGRFAAGDARALEGVPIAVKDLIDTEGVRTTYGSAIFSQHIPDADAVAVRRVREAGAIVVGKTATHEFAWGITCENPHFGDCRNPWDPELVSGGSSGGSAAALAARAVPLALGSDTGGSIRIPAAFCGVTGFKPTYGRVDSAGTFPLARSLDHVGPMARRPRDAWRLYEVIAGIEAGALRPRAAERGGAVAVPEQDGLRELRLGLCAGLHGVRPSDEIERVLASIAATAEDLGAEVVDVEFDADDLIAACFATTQRVEALDAHRRRGLFPDRRRDYGEDVRDRLERAAELTLADYLGAAADRARVAAAFSKTFEQVDLLLTPVSAAAPVRIGEAKRLHRGRETDFRELVMGATTPQNLAGLPACTLRGGFDSEDLPVGLQLTGPQGSDARTVATAESLFEATSATQRRWPTLEN